MTPQSPTPAKDDSAATGASEADAAKPVDFEKNAGDGPHARSDRSEKDEPPDAAELAGTKIRGGDENGGKAGPGAVSPEDLTTDNDDGAG